MEYKVRKLNLLDIRHMAKILKEINISKEDFKDIVSDIYASAAKLSKNKENSDNVSDFLKAAAPALDGLICLFADSDSFWNFLASLLSVSYEELGNIGLTEIKDIIAAVIGDEQVTAFFTSISKAGATTAG